MRKTASRIAALLLAAMTLQLFACGNDAGTTNTGNDTSSGDTDTTAPETEKPFADNLGEYDFGGTDFTMLVRESRNNLICPESETGDVVNDSIYKRNEKISDRFNVNIKSVTLPDESTQWNQQLEGEVMSGSGDYDVVMPDYWWGCETHGLFLNLLDYDVFDFSAPYWCAGWNDSATIYGQLYSAVGSMSLDLIRMLEVIYFNPTLISSLALENPYDLVNNHKWTLDKMTEMATAALSDLDGNSEYNISNDRLGYACDLQAGRALLASAGMKIATPTADGAYEYNFMNDRFVTMYDKVYDIINNNKACYYLKNGSVDLATGDIDLNAVFKNDNLLFLGAFIGDTDNLRDMKTDYGIIPTPMLDESQESYVTYNLGTYYMAILKTAKDPQMSAVMLEALNAESYKSVVGTYFDTALKGKYSRDEETAKMLDLILSNAFFDFTFVNETATDHIVMWFFDQIVSKKEGIMSAYDKRKTSFEKKLTTLLETYKNN